MIKENCPHCRNIVLGEFTPSATRKWLTALAKRGGMKAVLTAAGSVIPGFGNVSGFLAGAAIDIIYGKDINKLVDYVADQFDDNKVFVFTCPSCGHTWTRTDDDVELEEECEIESETEEDIQEQFNTDFDSFMEEIDEAIDDASTVNILYCKMSSKGSDCPDTAVASQYFFLAGLCNLLRAKKYAYQDEINVKSELSLANLYLSRAIELFPDDEYKLMLAATKCLRCNTPKDCVKEGSIETASYEFENPTLFKAEWLIEIYEDCRFLSIVYADDIITDAGDGTYPLSLQIDLWKSGVKLQNPRYRMFSNYKLFVLYEDDEVSSGKYSLRAAQALNVAFDAEGYDVATIDPNNYNDGKWLWTVVKYAESIIENKNPLVAQDCKRGMTILREIADLDVAWEVCYAKELACKMIARYYEEGRYVEKDLPTALKYYKLGGYDEDVERLQSSINLKSPYSNGEIEQNNESEYLEELRVSLMDGEISKGERRLLEKLRVKLGISERRAQELEDSLLKPQLTDEEQEYLDEYRECLAEGGSISAGERRLLNRLRVKLGISEPRAAELETL